MLLSDSCYVPPTSIHVIRERLQLILLLTEGRNADDSIKICRAVREIDTLLPRPGWTRT